MKIFPLFMLLFAIQVSIMIFESPELIVLSSGDSIPILGNMTYAQGVDVNATQAFNYTEPQTGVVSSILYAAPSAVWEAIASPFSAGRTALYVFLIALGGYVFALGLFASRNEMVYLTPIFALFLGVGFVPCYNLWHVIAKDLSPVICGVSGVTTIICGPAGIIGMLVAGPLYILWLMSCLEYWSARQIA
jgi:hypothetical protein